MEQLSHRWVRLALAMSGLLGLLGLPGLPGLSSVASAAYSGVTSNPATINISGALDLVGEGGVRTYAPPEQKFVLREAELMFNSAVDQLFDATLTMSAHREGGEQKFEVHEGFLASSRLIPRSRLRLGFFFLGFGRLNTFHRHDWPFVSAPRVQKEFFREEAVSDAGAEYSYLLPFDDVFLELTAGVTSGWRFEDETATETRPAVPTHYLRLAHFLNLPAGGNAQLALNYVGRNTGDGQAYRYYGIDLTSKWRNANMLKFLLQTELWLRTAADQSWGAYLYPEYWTTGPGGYAYAVGARWDIYRAGSASSSSGAPRFETALVPQLTWKPSEFTMVRLNYEWDWAADAGQSLSASGSSFQIQAIVVLGAHPAHDF